MMKVSNTMLAVIAALQSGTHTRRKARYLKEEALVSGLYPIEIGDDSSVLASVPYSLSFKEINSDRSVLSAGLVGEVRSSNVTLDRVLENIDYGVGISGFEIDVVRQEIVELDYLSKDDVFYSIGISAFNIDRYSVNFSTIEPGKEDVAYSISASINLTKG